MLGGKLFDLLNSLGGTLLESNLMQPFVKVDGVLPCDSILHTAFFVHHLQHSRITLTYCLQTVLEAERETGQA